MSADNINIGLIGAGGNTKLRHIPGFNSQGSVFIQSVCNRSKESGQKVADEYGIEVVHENWVELLEDPNNDAVCIGTWPYMHSNMVISALENGKHVMTEARMCATSAEAHLMLETSKLYPELITQIVPAPHTLNLDKTIKKLISEGYLGEIISIDASVTQGGFIDRNKPFHWRQSRDLSGYNIMGLGIWYEAIMRWVGDAATVQALTKINVPTRVDEDGHTQFITVPDHVEIICEMYSGPIMHIKFSDVLGHAAEDTIWLYGTEGTLKIDGTNRKIFGGRRSDNDLKEIAIEADLQGDWRVEEEFINAIRGQEKITHTTFEDGVRYMEFIEAVTRSAQAGEKIHLPF